MEKAKEVTLRDLLPLMWTITKLDVIVRNMGALVQEYIISEDATEKLSVHQRLRMDDGQLTAIDIKVNSHGDPTRSGAEMGWGVEENRIQPKGILDMTVTSMQQMPCYGGDGTYLIVNLEQGEHQIEMELEPATQKKRRNANEI